MRNMKKIISFFVGSSVVAAVLLACTIPMFLQNKEDVFWNSYQRSLQYKYDCLMNANDPKIIIVSGSSGAFGIDTEQLQDATGYKVVNISVMANLGPEYMCQMALANLNPGDIILLTQEYEFWLDYKNFESINGQVLISAIDQRKEMYQFFSPKQRLMLLGSVIPYARYRNTYMTEDSVYSVFSFNQDNGDMIYPRPSGWYVTSDSTPKLDLADYELSSETINYFASYKKQVEAAGAHVYFVPPAIAKGSITCDYELFNELAQNVEEKIGIQYIGNPVDYFYEDSMMYDGYYHLNDVGEKNHTEGLGQDLLEAGVL